jgi:hypothetical protein
MLVNCEGLIDAADPLKLARHKNLATTMKYYRGKTEEADRKALEMMEKAFALIGTDRTGERCGEQVLQT